MMAVYVLAGSHRQAMAFAVKIGADLKDIVYLASASDIRTRMTVVPRGATLHITGTATARPDIDDAVNEAASRGINVVYDGE